MRDHILVSQLGPARNERYLLDDGVHVVCTHKVEKREQIVVVAGFVSKECVCLNDVLWLFLF
jgi:hypothetical protein